MTQNEAKAFVANKDNWHVIGVTEYARIIRLQYKSLTYIAIQTKQMNMTDWYLHKEVVIEWINSLYYIFDQEHDCIGYACRPTQMANEIWQESKRDNK